MKPFNYKLLYIQLFINCFVDAIVNFIHPSNSPTYNVIEGNGVVQLILNLTNPLSRDISVQVISADGSATSKSNVIHTYTCTP